MSAVKNKDIVVAMMDCDGIYIGNYAEKFIAKLSEHGIESQKIDEGKRFIGTCVKVKNNCQSNESFIMFLLRLIADEKYFGIDEDVQLNELLWWTE